MFAGGDLVGYSPCQVARLFGCYPDRSDSPRGDIASKQTDAASMPTSGQHSSTAT